MQQFFEGLPVLDWMSLLDKRTNAPIVIPSLKEDPADGPMSAAERRERREEMARKQQEQVASAARSLPMSGTTHYYAYYERAIRKLAETVWREGPFEGFIGFSQARPAPPRARARTVVGALATQVGRANRRRPAVGVLEEERPRGPLPSTAR